jgi:hypothetical protein
MGMDGLVNGQILLAGLLCALGLNALTAWVRLARARGVFWQTVSAIFQTLALPFVYVIVLLQPLAFSSLLGRAPHAELVIAFALSLLVFLLLWRLFVELTQTIPALRRQRAEAALGRRLIRFARQRQGRASLLPPPVLIPGSPGAPAALLDSTESHPLTPQERALLHEPPTSK